MAMKPKPLHRVHAIVLAATLILAAGGIVLCFARGLGQTSLLAGMTPFVGVLPFGLCFLLYIILEAISIFSSAEEPVFSFAQDNHRRTVKIAFAVTAVSAVVGIAAAIVAHNNNLDALSCIFAVAPSLLGGLAYLVASLVEAIRSKKDGKTVAILSVYLGVLIVFGATSMALVYNIGLDLIYLFVGFPILCLALAMVGRGD